ncbi:ATP-binding protein [Fulvivirgaceae bacterium BMA10]|uniref:histidine kinase n=1 Tax=Splendidivirga corallicola TaxID=3051826 RepID=A0ABT8KTB6_9BACT|nr:ATP-binding protein [Fulvivirgaceae bacterium BMA10]
MYQRLYQIWIKIIYYGVHSEMEDALKKSIILSNLASISLAFIFITFNIVQTFLVGKYYVSIMTGLISLYLISIPILNRASYVNFTRISMCFVMPISLMFVVPLEHLTNPDSRDITYYTVPRFTILAMMVLPSTLLNYKKRFKVIAALGVIVLCLLFLEEIHSLFSRNYQYSTFELKRLYMIKAVSLATFFFLTLGFTFFRRVNIRFERRVSNLLDAEKTANYKLQVSKHELEEAYEELHASEANTREKAEKIVLQHRALEESHRKISELLKELKQTNNELLESQAELEEAYEELQSAESITRERAQEIEHQKNEIERKNRLLAVAQERIKETNEELMVINSSLEEKVNMRTKELMETNEELLLANQELDLFIYRASHDLRGPIASILGLTKIAKLEDQKDAHAGYFMMLEKTANNANDILSKLLLVNVVNQAADCTNIDFKVLINNLRENFDGELKRYSIDFKANIETDACLVSDVNHIMIICERLLENAIHFRSNGKRGTPYVHMNIKKAENGAIFEIEDNGIGIAKNFHQRIFGMFFRASERSKGNGLGLYIARKAIDRLGGAIMVESEPGVGSTFRVRFYNMQIESN